MNLRYSLLLFLGFGLLGAGTASGQDIHFSQFYVMPVHLNPALTGLISNSYRIAGIYRNQWNSVSTPYETYGLSYDMRVLEGKLDDDIAGAGLGVTYDRAGSGNLSYLSIMASGSYHKALGAENKNFIGLGLQLGIINRSLDYNSIDLPSQFDGSQFTQSSGEQFSKSNITYFDLHAGVLWSAQVHKRVGVAVGAAAYHLAFPKESFLEDDVTVALRTVTHAGIRAKIIEAIYLTPNFVFMNQDKAREINVGSGIEYHFGDQHSTVVGLGGWYRPSDAPIISASVEYRSIRVGLAYDVNTSSLKPATNNRGAFEISLVYLGSINKVQAPVLVPCPRL